MDLTTIERYGLPIAVLAFLAFVWMRQLWPFLVTQITLWQNDRAKERDAFIASLKALEMMASEAHIAHSVDSKATMLQVEALALAVRQVAVLVERNYQQIVDERPHEDD